MARVLLVEDEPGIASFVRAGLEENGHRVLVVEEGLTAGRIARDDDFELVILDLGLPDVHGTDVIEEVRRRGETLPILVLTASDDIGTKVTALEGGASDYLTKPFALDELLARVSARLRESAVTPAALSYDSNGVHLDVRTRKASVDGRSVELSAREFDLARVLMEHAGQVITKHQLLSRVWGYDFEGTSNVVEVYVNYLRRKLGHDRIETIRGVGYRFCE
jgi:DNA-binding response OmpR family regulator